MGPSGAVRLQVLLGAAALTVFAVALANDDKPKAPSSRPATVAKTIDFNRDVRMILSNNCFKCHGFDEGSRSGGFRLDVAAEATAKRPSGKTPIVPGSPEKSELVRRINADESEVMPPTFTHKALKPAEKDTLVQWIKEGAEYKEHWAFTPVVRPAVPVTKDTTWPKSDIDRFILAKLESSGLKPSPEADRATLIRRVTLDITGLPPTPKETDAFLADTSPNAYEKVVDRLLASSRYGERMAMDWLDAARYADSNGYQADFERYQWRWRDWVIDAYNQNLPYDRFIVEQVAGDMLRNATLAQKIATGFNRNHRINTEGGVIAEEWRIETVIDRVETTSQAFLGLTSGCARCHDHKYDPITQRDFYRMFAYYNNVPETGSGEERPINHPPTLKAPTPVQEKQLAAATERFKALETQVDGYLAANATKTAGWVPTSKPWPTGLDAKLEGRWKLGNPTLLTAGTTKEPATTMGKVGTSYGRSTGSVGTRSDAWIDLGQAGDVERTDAFSFGAWIFPEEPNGAAFSKMDVANDYRGWDTMLAGGTVLVHIINKWPTNVLKIFSTKPLPTKQWSHVFVTYDGSSKPEGLKLYVNGAPAEVGVEKNSLTETIRTKVPLTVGRRTTEQIFNGQVDDFMFFRASLSADEVKALADVNPAAALVSIPAAQRTPEQSREVTRQWGLQTDPTFAKLSASRDQALRERGAIDAAIPTLMVMQEMPKPREAHVLKRGEYDKLGEKVDPATPSFLPPLPTGAPNNRLGFAEWIASPTNPLTARVAVNRMWERLFGTGIVASSEDFGTRAEFPSHPELLDWLASEFVRVKWDQKAMLKQMVMSATYRQSSAIRPEHLKADPTNRLLARGPRFRLSAETIRDQALAASGLLVNKLGGPSVRPVQPPGVWDETNFYGNLRNYKPDAGTGRYRRSLYTIWKRTAAPPNMLLFDAPTREMCRTKRARTNTPLQALTLLNDPTYVEAARVLAQNAMKAERDSKGQVEYVFRRILSREPTSDEYQKLVAALEKRTAKYASDPEAATALVRQGAWPLDPALDKPRLAALTTVASTVLNLDEAVTKE